MVTQIRTRTWSAVIRTLVCVVAGAVSLANTGCTSMLSPIQGVPAHIVPQTALATPRANWIPLPLTRLRMPVSDVYELGAGDILGIYVEGVLPPRGEDEAVAEAPPVNFPEEGSDLPPSIGFPIPVRDDGTIALPLVDPITVEGKTITEVEELIRNAFTIDRRILQRGRDRVLVSLMRERRHRVIVVREDAANDENARIIQGQYVSGDNRSGEGFVIDLPAYKNDLMHALAESGGLPGLNAKNEVRILRSRLANKTSRADYMNAFYDQYAANPWMQPPEFPDDPSVVRIPLRFPPGRAPRFTQDDIILEEGDIVYIEARDTEFFYTGGLLPGGQYPIPRDYDLDVLGAMSMAGQGIGGNRQNGGGGAAGTLLGGGFGGATPSLLYIFRKLPNGQELTIEVDLTRAMNNPSQRLLVMPGDTLVLRYKPCEEVVNFSLIALFTAGIGRVFN